MTQSANALTAPGDDPAAQPGNKLYALPQPTGLRAQGEWPLSLRNTADIMANSPVAQVLLWGENKVMLYNQAYVELTGPCRLAVPGGAAPAVLPPVWSRDTGVLEVAMNGTAQACCNQAVPVCRDGQASVEELDLYYTPIREAADKVSGVLCVMVPSLLRHPEQACARTGLRMLVVEDNADAQYLVCEMLRALGHEVESTLNGECAADLLSQQEFDVLFTDVCLPGMSGVELARAALRGQPRLKIIFASGYGPGLTDRLEFPAVSLQKPYEIEDLQVILENISLELHETGI